jgi:hypothetical protein
MMQLSQSQTTRLFTAVMGLSVVAIAACTPTKQTLRDPNEIANRNTTVAKPVATATASANASPKEKFVAILGRRDDGWLPKVLAGKGLKKGLSSTEVGKIIPGAEAVTEYGFSKVNAKDIPGLKRFEFYYMKDGSGTNKLESVRLTFDPKLNSAYPDLVQVLSDKYGAAKPEDVKQEMIVWVNPDFLSAQLTKQVTDLGAYELNVSFEKEAS